jgi:hypothetical protein
MMQGVPLLPTVGCQLGLPRATPQPAGNPFELYKAMNNTSRHIGDYDFVHENPIYKPLVAVRFDCDDINVRGHCQCSGCIAQH